MLVGGTPEQTAARDAYDRLNIPRNLKKSETRSADTKALGHRVHGDWALILGPENFVRRLFDLTWATLGKERVTLKWMQILLGRWSRNMQYCRNSSSCFYYVWKALMKWGRARKLTNAAQAELMHCKL